MKSQRWLINPKSIHFSGLKLMGKRKWEKERRNERELWAWSWRSG
jgi:hypothetical protein